jgi:hypothetical protein
MPRTTTITIHDGQDHDIVEKAAVAMSEMYPEILFSVSGTTIGGAPQSCLNASGHERLLDGDFVHGLAMFACGVVWGFKSGRMSNVKAV